MSPIAMDPDARGRYVLRTDREGLYPKGQEPTFLFRFLTARQTRAYALELDAVGTTPPTDAETTDAGGKSGGEITMDELVAAAGKYVAGWERMKRPDGRPAVFGETTIDEICTSDELWEVAFSVLKQQDLTEEQSKNSAWPSPGSTGESAPTVEAAETEVTPAAATLPQRDSDATDPQ